MVAHGIGARPHGRRVGAGDSRSDLGGDRRLVQAALFRPVLQADVARLAPRRTPRILHDPVVRSDADGEHTVVERRSPAVAHNAALVRLPVGLPRL